MSARAIYQLSTVPHPRSTSPIHPSRSPLTHLTHSVPVHPTDRPWLVTEEVTYRYRYKVTCVAATVAAMLRHLMHDPTSLARSFVRPIPHSHAQTLEALQ